MQCENEPSHTLGKEPDNSLIQDVPLATHGLRRLSIYHLWSPWGIHTFWKSSECQAAKLSVLCGMKLLLILYNLSYPLDWHTFWWHIKSLKDLSCQRFLKWPFLDFVVWKPFLHCQKPFFATERFCMWMLKILYGITKTIFGAVIFVFVALDKNKLVL